MKLENIVYDCYQNVQNIIPEDDEKSQEYKYAGTPGAVHVSCDLCFCKSSRLLITALVDDDEALMTDDYQMIISRVIC